MLAVCLHPPVDGIVYTVKAGDTAESLGKYIWCKQRTNHFICFNDLEISGIQAGGIVIPSGSLPETCVQVMLHLVLLQPPTATVLTAVTYRQTGINFRSTFSNGYAYGYCTWYAYERRMQ